MRLLEGGVCAVEGVSAGGARDERYGVALVEGSGPTAGTFTSNRVRAAPVKVTQRRLASGPLDGTIICSGNANAFTGERGVEDAEWMADLPGGNFAVMSTGIIGRRLDRERVDKLFGRVGPSPGPEGSRSAAEAIMTTDTFPKEAAVEGDGFVVGGIAKGAGMIEPEMGTMLALLYTDASVDASTLQRLLRSAVRDSFNMVTVDGETSTNDTALLTSTGRSGGADEDELLGAVESVCTSLARMVARDGEGATKLLEVRVSGAGTPMDARRAARAVARSPLVKTALFGGDPNFGRVVSALGHSGASLSESDISIKFVGDGEVAVAERGCPVEFDEGEAGRILRGDEVAIEATIGEGEYGATAYGCDLSPGYVEVNAAYGEEG